MQPIRFKTKVLKNGVIKLPDGVYLPDEEVEILVIPNPGNNINKISPDKFISKWAGFLNSEDTDKAKFDYLTGKHK